MNQRERAGRTGQDYIKPRIGVLALRGKDSLLDDEEIISLSSAKETDGGEINSKKWEGYDEEESPAIRRNIWEE